jgi:hypothetical protein
MVMTETLVTYRVVNGVVAGKVVGGRLDSTVVSDVFMTLGVVCVNVAITAVVASVS